MQRWLLSILIILTMLFTASIGSAQDGNLLRDPSFEGQYTSRGRSDLNVPADWSFWVATAPRTESWMNLDPVGFPHNGPGPSPQNGARAVNFNRGFATFTVAIFQQVNVTAGANLIGTAYAYLKTCNLAPNSDNCGSAVESGAFTRVGIDPTGGTDPNSPAIIWSGNALPHDRWDAMTVNATAQATTVTFFIYVTQRWPSQINNVYFDNASLVGGGAGGVAPAGSTAVAAAPVVPQTVPFVVAQGENDDGSIVHTVQPGDTVDSIAVAYGVGRQQILDLNDIRDPRIIQVGQQLIIRESSSSGGSSTTAETTPEPAPTEVVEQPVETAATAEVTAEATAQTPPEPTAEATTAPAASESTPEPAPVEPLDLSALPTAPVRSASTGGVVPAVDPAAQTGQVCVLMFNDLNQNRIQEPEEATLEGGSILLVSGGQTVASHETDGTEPFCFADLSAGSYVTSLAAPAGFGLTSPDQLTLNVTPGSSVTVAIGAAEGVAAPVLPSDLGASDPAETAVVEAAAPPANPLMDNLGLIALAAAGVVFIFGIGVTFALRRRS